MGRVSNDLKGFRSAIDVSQQGGGTATKCNECNTKNEFEIIAFKIPVRDYRKHRIFDIFLAFLWQLRCSCSPARLACRPHCKLLDHPVTLETAYNTSDIRASSAGSSESKYFFILIANSRAVNHVLRLMKFLRISQSAICCFRAVILPLSAQLISVSDYTIARFVALRALSPVHCLSTVDTVYYKTCVLKQ